MECAVIDSSVDWIWESLLEFKRWCRNNAADPPSSSAHVFFYQPAIGDRSPYWRFTAQLEDLTNAVPKSLIIVPLAQPRSSLSASGNKPHAFPHPHAFNF